jgi:hypothetical protein
VLEEGARSRRVYLPRGSRWQRVTVDAAGRLDPAGRALDGGRTVTAPAPLADIPVFVRAGSVRGPGGDGGGEGGGGGDSGGGGDGAGEDAPDAPASPGGESGDTGDPQAAGGPNVASAADASVAVGADGGGDAVGDDAALPFTGLSLAAIAAAGLALLLVGRAARSRSR